VIFDQHGNPYPEKSIGEQYTEALLRNWRDNKWTLTQHVLAGWTPEQHRHWVETGEEP
jgi:hypothetical protein